MANPLNIDLEGKAVVLRQEVMADGQIATEHPFRCDHGFGLRTHTSGRMISGLFLSDRERGSISSEMIERLATLDEVAAAMGEEV